MRRLDSVAAMVVVLGLVAAGCGKSGGDDDDGGGAAGTTTTAAAAQTTTTVPAVTAERLCADAELADPSPKVAEDDLTEASGVVASTANDGVLWMHNDSGGNPEVFAVGMADGAARGRFTLEGAEATDWEDIALGPGAEGASELYLGDIGDNDSRRSNVTVYRVTEPTVPSPAGEDTLPGVDAHTLTYADGARDAEALLADPDTGDLFVVSKQWDGAVPGVYRIPADALASPGTSVEMERTGDAKVAGGDLVTGGEISPDGSIIGLRTYTSVLLWERAPDQTVTEALAGEPCKAAAAPETQGEALGFLPDGAGYVTVSEGEHPEIHVFRLP
jgi:hypothetical protein